MCLCFCSLWFIFSFSPWGSSGVQYVVCYPWRSMFVPGDPVSFAFFKPLSPPGMHCLSLGVHVGSGSVFRRKCKKNTWHYVVWEVHHFFHQFECLSLSSGVSICSVVEFLYVAYGCTSRMHGFFFFSQHCVSKSAQALKSHKYFSSIWVFFLQMSLQNVREETERVLWCYG